MIQRRLCSGLRPSTRRIYCRSSGSVTELELSSVTDPELLQFRAFHCPQRVRRFDTVLDQIVGDELGEA